MSHFLLKALREHSQATSSRPAVSDSTRTLNWGELRDAVDAEAEALDRLGLRPGDLCVLHMESAVDWVVKYLALAKSLVAVLPIPYATPMEGALRHAGEIRASWYVSRDVTRRFGAGPVHLTQAPLLHLTSGTTGPSVAVPRSELNLRSEARAVAETLQLSSSSGVLCCTPVGHSFAAGLLHAAILAGSHSILMEGFRPSLSLELMREWRPWVVAGTPYIFEGLISTRGLDSSLMEPTPWALCGGARMSAALSTEWHRATGQMIATEYGLSEVGIVSINLTPSLGDVSVGQLLPDCRVSLKPSLDGPPELLAWRPGISLTALGSGGGSVDLPSQIGPDGETYLATGDLGTLDPDGRIILSGRIKSMINVAGTSVIPDEVELVLLSLPSVAAAAVIGLPDAARGEVVAAAIVANDFGTLPARSLASELRRVLPTPAVPRHWMFLESLPRTSTGKIDKQDLTQRFEAGNRRC